MTAYAFKLKKVNEHSRNSHLIEVFYEIVDFFVLDMCSKPIFCSKIALKGKTCLRFLKPQKVAPNAKKLLKSCWAQSGQAYIFLRVYIRSQIVRLPDQDLSSWQTRSLEPFKRYPVRHVKVQRVVYPSDGRLHSPEGGSAFATTKKGQRISRNWNKISTRYDNLETRLPAWFQPKFSIIMFYRYL